jgi:predicted DNA-binding protein
VLAFVLACVYTYSMKEVRLDMRIDKPTKDALAALSAKTGAPISELVRRSIAAYLKRAKGEK